MFNFFKKKKDDDLKLDPPPMPPSELKASTGADITKGMPSLNDIPDIDDSQDIPNMNDNELAMPQNTSSSFDNSDLPDLPELPDFGFGLDDEPELDTDNSSQAQTDMNQDMPQQEISEPTEDNFDDDLGQDMPDQEEIAETLGNKHDEESSDIPTPPEDAFDEMPEDEEEAPQFEGNPFSSSDTQISIPVMQPITTKSDIYLSIDAYREVLHNIEYIEQNTDECEAYHDEIDISLKGRMDNSYRIIQNNFSQIQKKLAQIDKILFER